MKILHYSDRGSTEFMALYIQCDILVATGDLSLFDFAGLEDVKEKKPAFGVYGNHCSGNYMDQLGIINLHQQIYEYGGYSWGGWQGCIKYKESSAPMYTEEEAAHFADSFPRVDILLLHAGPLGMLDDQSDTTHTGSASVRNYVLLHKPTYVFCGHQYSDDRMNIDGTTLYRTYGARIIEI